MPARPLASTVELRRDLVLRTPVDSLTLLPPLPATVEPRREIEPLRSCPEAPETPLLLLPLPAWPDRLRFLITSVLRESGRTTPCSLRNSPHALHNGWPSGLRRQSGVVWVWQFVQDVGGCWPPLLEAAPAIDDTGGALLLGVGSLLVAFAWRTAAESAEVVASFFRLVREADDAKLEALVVDAVRAILGRCAVSIVLDEAGRLLENKLP